MPTKQHMNGMGRETRVRRAQSKIFVCVIDMTSIAKSCKLMTIFFSEQTINLITNVAHDVNSHISRLCRSLYFALRQTSSLSLNEMLFNGFVARFNLMLVHFTWFICKLIVAASWCASRLRLNVSFVYVIKINDPQWMWLPCDSQITTCNVKRWFINLAI